MRKGPLLPTLLLGACTLCGCGYNLGSVNPNDPIKTIAVPTFKNSTEKPAIEARATTEIINRFVIDGHYKVVDKKHADAILIGELYDYRRDALRFDQDTVTKEYRLTVAARIRLQDAKTGKVIWGTNRVEGDTTFFVVTNLPESERRARPDAFEDLAKDVVERTVERW